MTTKTAQFTPVCTCQAVREYYDTGIGGMFEDKVKLCPFHTAAPAMYEALLDLVICPTFNSQVFEKDKESHRAWTLARAALAQAEGR